MSWPSRLPEGLTSNTFVKFCLIGVVNGIVGFSIILSLLYIFQVNYLVSNSLGYLGGILTSFLLNKYVNFRSDGRVRFEFPVFIVSFAIAYLANMLVLSFLVEFVQVKEIVGLILAAGVYTVLFYILSRFIVFKPGSLTAIFR